MKKSIAVLLLMILTCLTLVLFGACGGGKDDQGDNPPDTDVVDPNPDPVPGPDEEGDCATLGHNYTLDVSQSKDATCKEEGLIVKVCSRCGDVQKTPVGKLPHTYVADAENSRAASCKAEGVNAFKCSECGDKYTEPVEKLDHIFEPDEELSKDATCTVAGKRVLKCAECGTTSETPIPALGHSFTGFACQDRTCSACGAKAPASVEHSYVLSETLTDELQEGDEAVYCKGATYCIYECEVCHETKEEKKSDAIRHEVTKWEQEGELTLTDSANCDYERTLKGQCTLCGNTVTHTQLVEGNHKYKTVIETPATCTTEGKRHQECTVCHTTKPDSVETYSDPDAHNWVLNGSSASMVGDTEFYTCQYNERHTKQSLVSAESTLSTTAERAKSVDEVKLNGASIQMDETARKSLPNGYLTFGLEANAQSPAPADKVEGKDVYAITLKEGNSLVTEFGGGEVTVRLPYELKDGEDPDFISIWYINENGELEAIEATYVDGYAVFKTNHFSYYTVGIMTPEEMCARYGHAEKVFHSDATCLSNGYHTKICTRCGKVYEDEVLPALGHKWRKDDEKSRPATCTTAGLIVYVCENENCNKKNTERVPALGHAWTKDAANSEAATCTKAGKDVYTCDNGCELTLESVVPMTPHDCTEVVTKPTCTAGGYTTFTCKDCHIVYTGAETAPTGHIWNMEAPTCTEGQTCTVCGAKGQQATGHTWDIEEPTCTQGQTCTVCGAEGKPKLPHTYGEQGYCTVCGDGCSHNFIVLEDVASTCTVAGYTTSRCSICNQIKTETKELLAHSFDDLSGRCTVCGAVDPARSSEYFDVLMSLKADCYTVDLSGLTFEEESETFAVTATIEEGEAYFTFKDGRPVFLLSITRISQTTTSVGHDEGQDISRILEYSDGYTMVMEYTMNGETFYERMPMDSGNGTNVVYSELALLTKLVQDEEIATYVKKLFNSNYMVLSALLDKSINSIFTRKDDATGYTLSLNREGIVALSEMFMENTVREIVEKVIGAGNFDKLVAYVKEMMTEKTVKEAIDDLLTRAEEYHIQKDELFAFVNYVANLLYEEIGKIQSSIGGSMGGGSVNDPSEGQGNTPGESPNPMPDYGYNEPAAHAEGGESQPEQPKFDIEALYNDENLSKATIAEAMGLGNDDLAEMIDGYVNNYAGLKPYEIVEGISGGQVTGEMIHDIVTAVFEGDALDISLRVEGGKAKSILFNAKGLEITNAAEQGIDIRLSGSIVIELGEGEFELPAGGRDSKLLDAISRRIQQNDGTYTLRTKDGFYGGRSIAFTQEGDKIRAVITVDSIEGFITGIRSVFVIEDLGAAEVQVQKACGDGVYSYAYTAKWQRSTRIRLSFDDDGNASIEELGTSEGHYYGSNRFTIAFNEVTGTFEDSYSHNFVVDATRSQSPDSVECEEYYKVVEVCSKCGETREYSTRKSHNINRRYVLLDKGGDCEDGVYSESYCTVCNKVLYSDVEDIFYDHETYPAIDVIKTADGEFRIEYMTCACGREKCYENIYHIHDGKEYPFLHVGSVGTVTTYACTKGGCDAEVTINATRSVVENCYEYRTYTVTISGEAHAYRYTYDEHHTVTQQEDQTYNKEYSIENGDPYNGYRHMTTYHYECGHKPDYVVIYEERTDVNGRQIYHLRKTYNIGDDDNAYYELYEYRYESDDSCKYEYYASNDKDKEPEYRHSGTNHREAEPQYRLLGETCEDGVEVTYVCSVCGEVTYTDVFYDHRRMDVNSEVRAADGSLVAQVYTYSCACGEEMERVNIKCYEPHHIDLWTGDPPTQGPNGHKFYEYRCGVEDCNITVTEERWEEFKNCRRITYSVYTFYEDGKPIGDPNGYKGWYEYPMTEHDVTEKTTTNRNLSETELAPDWLGDNKHVDAHGTYRVVHYDYHCDHAPDCTTTRIEMYDKYGRMYYSLEKTVLDADGNISEYYESRWTFTDSSCEGYHEWRYGENEDWHRDLYSDHSFRDSNWVEETCTQYGYVEYTCSICGTKHIYESDITRPRGHFYVDGVCVRCGLSNAQGADGQVTLEDMSTEQNYVVGAWAAPDSFMGDFMHQTYFVFRDAEGNEQTIECTAAAWVESYRLPQRNDSRIYTLAKSSIASALAAAKQEGAGKGWTYVGVKFLLIARFNYGSETIHLVLTEQSIYDDSVSEDLWRNAFHNCTNFTLNIEHLNFDSSGIFKHDGDKIDISATDGIDFMQIFIEKEGDTYFEYTMTDNVWHKDATTEEQLKRTGNLTMPHLLEAFVECYNEFTLESGKYTCARLMLEVDGGYVVSPVPLYSVEVMFIDGALIGVRFALGADSDSTTYAFSAFGTTSVTLPSVF